MKKLIIPIIIIIMILTTQLVFANDNIQKNSTLSILNIDTNFNNTFFKEDEKIHIEGWKLATEKNTKLVVYLDGQKIDENCIKYSKKYDLISIVKGYGTYEENPQPNFDIDIPIQDVKTGKHKLKIVFTTENEENILETVEKDITISKNVKHVLNIDSPLNGDIFNKSGIEVNGWKLATEADTKLVALIDGKEIENTQIDMYYAYDLISIVKGYGTYKENPKPNFTIHIPTNQISQGKHKLKIQFKTSDDVLLEETEREIIIDKSIKHVLNIDTVLSEQSWSPNGIKINGWKLATDPNTKIEVFIENRKVENLQIAYTKKYDLISIVKGYGTYKENPQPHFDITIPETEFKSGDNEITLKFLTEQGEVLEEFKSNILEYKTTMHIETIYDRTTITNDIHQLVGWNMITIPNTKVRVLIDGYYRDEIVKRYERPDVLNAIKGYGGEQTNPQPGFGVKIDFSQFNLGLHQIAVRIEDEQGRIYGEQVIYIFLRPKIIYEQGTYGESGLLKSGSPYGSKLEYYRYGNGPNVLFTTFTVHGFEDNWWQDGEALVYIANRFYEELKNNHKENYALADEWTIYILPEVNPDGRRHGTTNNGPGRTTLYSQAPNNKGIDLNRCWKTSGFVANETSRNYAGTAPFQAYEAQALRDFMQSHKSQNGQTILVDLHGWLQQLVGNREVGMYYAVQFPENHGRSLDRYGDGYMIGWARTALANNGRLAKASLVELPQNVHSMQDVKNQRLAERYIHATLSMLNGII